MIGALMSVPRYAIGPQGQGVSMIGALEKEGGP